MKAVFVSPDDIKNKNTWSGIPYYICKNLKENFEEVYFISPIPFRKIDNILSKISKMLNKILKILFGKSYFEYLFADILLRYYSTYVEEQLLIINYDVIISTSSLPFYFSNLSKPLILIADGTAKMIREIYSRDFWYQRLYKRSEQISRIVTEKSSRIVTPSFRTKDSLIMDYGVSKEKVYVLPFGANIDNRNIIKTEKAINRGDVINFLLVGKDFYGKGTDIAISICEELINKNVNLRFFIIGSKVPKSWEREWIENIVFLDKNVKTERDKLEAIYSKSHFYIMPTRAEMYGIVFCEAAAYSLPVISTDVGGVSTIVLNNKTGVLLPLKADIIDYVTKILTLINDPNLYRKFSDEARLRYETVLNWSSFGKGLYEICEKVIKN